jgi:transposase
VITTDTAYENLSREELVVTVVTLKHELDQLKRLVFGSRHERFVSATPEEQLALGLDIPLPDQAQPVSTKTISYSRTVSKSSTKESGGRMKFPADLPRQQIFIKPTEDVTGCKEIGQEVTEELEYTPGNFFVRQYIRPKYARPQGQGVVIGTLPTRFIEKGVAGPGLLAQVLIDKYVDHLPLFRQIERFKRAGITLPISTMSDWVAQCCQQIEVLYEAQRDLILSSDYLEGDETTIKVLDRSKKGKTHLGYYWVYRAPLENLVLFDYRQGRGGAGPKELLKNFKGYLQTDGYDVYDSFGHQQGITLVGCMAHARRYFDKALDNDKQRAEHVLTLMQQLYAIERKAKEENLDHAQRYQLRQQEAVPILKTLEQWMKDQYVSVPDKSSMAKAIFYSLQRWEKLCLYTTDGKLQIDNNLVENSIRPIAIGRKNYLFAGSHNAAQRAAMLYTLLGTCKINSINPYEWLKDVFERIPTHSINKIQELLPHNWRPATSPHTQNS